MANYRTVVPGIQDGKSGNAVTPKGGQRTQEGTVLSSRSGAHYSAPDDYQSREVVTGKPIVGFLVSVSRTEEGEYWVLRQGQNTIGSGDECDVVLNEISVSRVHGVLAIHRNPGDNNRLNVGIMERGSSNGIFVNNSYIGFNPYQCKNLDKIKIGNYELILFLFDAAELGLAKVEGFTSGGGSFDYSDREMYPESDKTRI
jgi:pSer/pThr/pTyr-binding forkhead associated (FHA) protein